MTNKEAIEILKGIYPDDAYSPTERQHLKAINMAIAALTTTQKEPACIYNRTPEERKVSCRYCSATCKARVEETASEDLEQELNRWRHEHFHGRRDKEANGEYLERLSQLDIARHFANWQNKQMLEALRTEYEKGRYDMREEMMKEAINCKVFWYDGPKLDYTQEQQDDALEKIGANIGDKVKLIIVKEE